MAEKPHFLVHVLRGRIEDDSNLSVEMDGAVWSALPEQLVERVLLALPITSKHKFRAVCRNWLALLSSRGFLEPGAALASSSSADPLVCAFEYRIGNQDWVRVKKFSPKPNMPCETTALSHSCLGKVYKLDLSYLPQKFHEWFEMWSIDDKTGKLRRDSNRCSKLRYDFSSQRCGSQDGFIYILNDDDGWEHIGRRNISVYVVNPFTRTWKELPELLIFKECTCWTAKLEVQDSSFKFTLVCGSSIFHGGMANYSRPFNWSIYVYTSGEGDGDWNITEAQCTQESPEKRVLAGAFMYSYQCWNGDLIVHSLLDGRRVSLGYDRMGIQAHFLVQGNWMNSLKPALLEHLGVVYLVGDFVDAERELHIGLWKLDQECGVLHWELSSVFPRKLLENFGDVARELALPIYEIEAFMIGGAIYLNVPTSTRGKKGWAEVWLSIVAFDPVDHSWQVVAVDTIKTKDETRKYGLLQPKFDFFDL